MAKKRKILDQLKRKVEFPENPCRIVSLVPSQTELLVDLGLKDAVLGITKFCVHPKDLRKEKKIVGGTKNVHFDRIEALKPDIILCNKEENTKEMVLELEKIAPVHVSDIEDLEDSLALIRQYGDIFKVEEKASEIEEKISFQIKAFQEFIKKQPIRRVAYLIWQKPWMAAGKNTFINYLLEMNRFQNALLKEDSRYPEIELSSLREKKVDLLLLSSEPFPFKEKHRKELQKKLPGIRVMLVDGEYFSWYGSRLMNAFKYFKSLQLSLQSS